MPVELLIRVIKLLEVIGDFRVDGANWWEREELSPDRVVQNAQELGHALRRLLEPELAIGDRVRSRSDPDDEGTLLAIGPLWNVGWDAHVEWDRKGIEVTTIHDLERVEPTAMQRMERTWLTESDAAD